MTDSYISHVPLLQSTVASEVVGSIPGQTHSSCDKEGDSLRQRRFPPGLRFPCKSTNIVHRANNVLVDTQFSIQYLSTFRTIGTEGINLKFVVWVGFYYRKAAFNSQHCCSSKMAAMAAILDLVSIR
jgi:hypothetical protein